MEIIKDTTISGIRVWIEAYPINHRSYTDHDFFYELHVKTPIRVYSVYSRTESSIMRVWDKAINHYEMA